MTRRLREHAIVLGIAGRLVQHKRTRARDRSTAEIQNCDSAGRLAVDQKLTVVGQAAGDVQREVRMFYAIAPMAAMLIKVATEREQLRQALASAEPHRGVILLEEDDFIAWANPCAKQQLSRFFYWSSQDNLPPEIAAWLAAPNTPLLQATGQARLKVTLVRNDQQRMLLCDELPAKPAPQLLQKLGLTPRQAEVLFWISRGKTNGEIGIIVGASVHTINRHVEAIFQRLNVESRSAAMVAALEVLGI